MVLRSRTRKARRQTHIGFEEKRSHQIAAVTQSVALSSKAELGARVVRRPKAELWQNAKIEGSDKVGRTPG